MKGYYTGEICIDGKKYKVKVVNGERYIDGKTIEEFMKTLSTSHIESFVRDLKYGNKLLNQAPIKIGYYTQ